MFSLHFTTDNAAFGETEADLREQIAMILDATAKNVRLGMGRSDTVTLRDTNGNTIGEWKILDRRTKALIRAMDAQADYLREARARARAGKRLPTDP